MRQQYGLRIQGDEFREMSWDEFVDLVCGLNEQTPLVRIAQIRLENDPEALKQYTPEQRSIRAEWRRKKALSKPKEQTDKFLSEISETFSKLFSEE